MTRKVIGIAFILLLARTAPAALRIVTYNMLAGQDNYNPSYLDEKIQVLIEIGNYPYNGVLRPFDILLAQELSANKIIENYLINGSGSVDGLNDYYGPGVYAYAAAASLGDGYNYNGMIYNTQTVQLLETVNFRAPSAPRGTIRYKFRIIGYDSDSDFYIYNAHMKAYDDEYSRRKRTAEAQFMRWSNTYGGDALPEGTHIIYAGDFNLTGGGTEDCTMANGDVSSIGGYDNPWYYLVKQQQFTGTLGYTYTTTGNGQAVDPSGISYPVNWNSNCSFRYLHTYNMIYPSSRLDFQLITHELYDGEGLSFIAPGVGNCTATENSYRPLGNDGTHTCNGRILDSTSGRYERSVFYDLSEASDHLPVIADYQRPAMMGVSIDMPPGPLTLGQNAVAQVHISNAAVVSAPAGADELDYTFEIVTGGILDGPALGIKQALDPITSHEITLDTSAPGSHELRIRITSGSQACPNPVYDHTFPFEIAASATLCDMARSWTASDGQPGYNPACDFDAGGSVNGRDFALFAQGWSGNL